MSPGLEALDYHFSGKYPAGDFSSVLVGVVGSGNLEVLLEPVAGNDGCSVHVETSARGFGATWEAVLADFHARHGLAGVAISINDMGATPAVVGLRLEQAAAHLGGWP